MDRFDVIAKLPAGSTSDTQKEMLQALLAEIRTDMGQYIADVQEQVRPPSGRFQEFEIQGCRKTIMIQPLG